VGFKVGRTQESLTSMPASYSRLNIREWFRSPAMKEIGRFRARAVDKTKHLSETEASQAPAEHSASSWAETDRSQANDAKCLRAVGIKRRR
jgi:hypothetical protein